MRGPHIRLHARGAVTATDGQHLTQQPRGQLRAAVRDRRLASGPEPDGSPVQTVVDQRSYGNGWKDLRTFPARAPKLSRPREAATCRRHHDPDPWNFTRHIGQFCTTYQIMLARPVDDQNGGYRTWCDHEAVTVRSESQDRRKATQVPGEPIPDCRSRHDEHRRVTMNSAQRLRSTSPVVLYSILSDGRCSSQVTRNNYVRLLIEKRQAGGVGEGVTA